MMAKFKMTKLVNFLILFITVVPTNAFSFYDESTKLGETEIRGFLSAGIVTTDNPEFYNHDRDRIQNLTARLLIDNYFNENLSLEFNGLVNYNLNTFGRTDSVTKYKSLELEDSNDRGGYKSTYALVDRLNLNYSHKNYNFKIGRAPQNLTILYYFRPNDFFEPFSENTFFRDFKEGVDSARLQYKITNLSELTLLAVTGFDNDTGYENELTSLIAQIKTPIKTFETSIIAGRVYDKKILGGYLQGELFNIITMRLEGHMSQKRFTKDKSNPFWKEKTNRIGLALEKYFANDFNIIVEGFYNGQGLEDDEYSLAIVSGNVPDDFLSKKYLSVGGGKLLTPIINLQGAVFFNLTDSSKLFSLYGTYSVSNEADISLSVNTTDGDKLKSEYGLTPHSLGLDFRIYF